MPDYKSMSAGELLTAMGTDASKWVEAFAQNLPYCNVDKDIILGWLANAIMAGYDAGKRSK